MQTSEAMRLDYCTAIVRVYHLCYKPLQAGPLQMLQPKAGCKAERGVSQAERLHWLAAAAGSGGLMSRVT